MFETRLKKNKTVIQNLEIIKGIGRYRAQLICQYLGINGNITLSKVPTRFIDNLLTVLANIKKQENTELIQIKELDKLKEESKEHIKNTSNIKTERKKLELWKSASSKNLQNQDKIINNRYILQESLKMQYFDKNSKTQLFTPHPKWVQGVRDNIKNYSIGGFVAFSLLNNIADSTPYNTIKRSRKILIEDQLKDNIKGNILNLIKINSYRGRRLKNGYPARGQRTRTNAHTAKRLNKFL